MKQIFSIGILFFLAQNSHAQHVGIGTTAPQAYGHGGINRILEIHNPATVNDVHAHLILSYNGTGSSLGGVTWAAPNVPGSEKRTGFTLLNSADCPSRKYTIVNRSQIARPITSYQTMTAA